MRRLLLAAVVIAAGAAAPAASAHTALGYTTCPYAQGTYPLFLDIVIYDPNPANILNPSPVIHVDTVVGVASFCVVLGLQTPV